jgi:uracil-DNA glycosylase family 4
VTEPVPSFDDRSREGMAEIVDDFRRYLAYVKGLGFNGVALSENALEILDGWGKQRARETLGAIRRDLGDCRRCQLSAGRKHIVFGQGDPKAKLVLVGEAPGYEEDVQGIPFVGEAGQLLTKMLKAINLSREEVYICNIIKCRPPKNRNPEPEEIAACIPFLQRQIEAISPRLICTLGAFAAQALLQSTQSISKLRGEFYRYKDIPLLPTYHPAYLLRNAGRKRQAWEDMQKLQEAYEKA